MNGFAGKMATGAVKQGKQTAQQIARRIASEQLEMLKSAKAQVGLPARAGEPTSEQGQRPAEMPAQPIASPNAQQQTESPEQMKARLDAESKRLLEKLEAELAQIRQKRVQDEQQRKQQEEQAMLVKQQQEQQAKSAEPPTAMGKLRKAMGGLKKKVQGLSSRHERQKSATG